MAQVNYAADVEQIDRMIQEIAAERPEGDVRLRLQPTILRGGDYRAWQGVSWTLTCQDAEEAIAVRDALKEFFQAVARTGAGVVEGALRTVGTY